MSGEPLQRSFVGFSRLFLTIARTRIRTKRVHDLVRRRRHFVDGLIESGLISARRSSRTSQLSHELKRRSANLVVTGRWLKVGERLDVAAHRQYSSGSSGGNHSSAPCFLHQSTKSHVSSAGESLGIRFRLTNTKA